jgi:acetyl esterase/lipase
MMAWLFLIFSIVSAALTYNLFHPFDRGRRRVVLSFFAGWLWGELALHAIAVQVLVAILFAALGVLESWVGVIALAITIGSCGALAWGYRLALMAAPVVERALRDTFGRGYEEQILPEHSSRFERNIRWRPILRPFPIRHPEVERIRDIPFTREHGVTLKLDVYRHRSMPDRCPTLLQIHGGAWVVGDKREQGLPLMNQLAERGWVCISANYRLSPHATFPDHLVDVKRALRWIKENGHRYGADPDFIVVTGGSAGGHLAALTALTANRREYQPGFEDLDTTVQGCIPVYGVYDFTDRHGLRSSESQAGLLEEQVMKGSLEEIPEAYREASPMDQVTDAAPPFMIIHGDQDVLVPVEEARRFSRLLRAHARVPPVYVEVPGAQHAFELFPSLRSQGIVDGIERFASYIYSDYLRQAGSGSSVGDGPREATSTTVVGNRDTPTITPVSVSPASILPAPILPTRPTPVVAAAPLRSVKTGKRAKSSLPATARGSGRASKAAAKSTSYGAAVPTAAAKAASKKATPANATRTSKAKKSTKTATKASKKSATKSAAKTATKASSAKKTTSKSVATKSTGNKAASKKRSSKSAARRGKKAGR